MRITKTTAMLSCAAVHSAWQVYMALPSPTSATTGRSGSASLTPIAAGRPQPMPPPRRPKKLCGSSLRDELSAARRPTRCVSSITTASFGSIAPIACEQRERLHRRVVRHGARLGARAPRARRASPRLAASSRSRAARACAGGHALAQRRGELGQASPSGRRGSRPRPDSSCRAPTGRCRGG